jgi:hypothetical protein
LAILAGAVLLLPTTASAQFVEVPSPGTGTANAPPFTTTPDHAAPRKDDFQTFHPDLGVPIGGHFDFSSPNGLPAANYLVADLVAPAGGRPPAPALPGTWRRQGAEERLTRLLIHTVAPYSWSDAGGKGIIHYDPLGLALVVYQPHDIQEQVAEFLQALRSVQAADAAVPCLIPLQLSAAPVPGPAQECPCPPVPLRARDPGIKAAQASPVGRHIAEVVEERRVTVHFDNTPFYQVIRDLRAAVGDDVNIVLDNEALREGGVRLDTPLTQSLYNMRLGPALNILLKDVDLTWSIKDEAIIVTTTTYRSSRTQVVVYPVADLVLPGKGEPTVPWMGRTLRGRWPSPSFSRRIDAEDGLVYLITHKVAPRSWKDAGGRGTIQFCPSALALVVNQLEGVHEDIADFLEMLRCVREWQVALDVSVVSMVPETFERVSSEFALTRPSNSGPQGPSHVINFCRVSAGLPLDVPAQHTIPAPALAFLNDTQAHTFLETVQADRRTCITPLPVKKTLDRLPIDLTVPRGREFTGLGGMELEVLPALSFWGQRLVHLRVRGTLDNTTPGAVDQVVVVPYGGTVLVGGFTTSLRVRREYTLRPPGSNSIPYLDRLSRTVVCSGCEERSLVILLTPRIIVHEEAEPGACAPR